MTSGEKTGASFTPTDRVGEEGARGLRNYAIKEILRNPQETEAVIARYRVELSELQDKARQAIARYREDGNADDLVEVYEFNFCGSGADSEYDDFGHLRSSEDEMIERLEEDVLVPDYVDGEIEFLRKSIELRGALKTERRAEVSATPETPKGKGSNIERKERAELEKQRDELERLIGVYRDRSIKEAAGFAKAFLHLETLKGGLTDVENEFKGAEKRQSELKDRLNNIPVELEKAWFWQRSGLQKEAVSLKNELALIEVKIPGIGKQLDQYKMKMRDLHSNFPTLGGTTSENLNEKIAALQAIAKDGSPYVQNLELQLKAVKEQLNHK